MNEQNVKTYKQVGTPLGPDLSFLKAIKLHLNRQNDVVQPTEKIIESKSTLKNLSPVPKKSLVITKFIESELPF